MKEFLQILRRFVPPYKKYLMLTVVFNILSAVLNIFSFAAQGRHHREDER